MEDKKVKTAKLVKLKFNQIAVNQKYLRKNAEGKSLWDLAQQEYIDSVIKDPKFGGVYKYLPNEDSVIQSMLINKYKEPYIFNRLVKPTGEVYSLDEINAMSDKEKAALPLYTMTEEEASFYLSEAQTKVLPRDDKIRAYKDKKDYERDLIKVPLAEIVG